LTNFKATVITVEYDDEKYKHNRKMVDFNDKKF